MNSLFSDAKQIKILIFKNINNNKKYLRGGKKKKINNYI